MKHVWLSLVIAVFCLSLSPEAKAQPLVFADATTRSVGVGGGLFFGRGSLQPGIFADIYHGNELDRFAPDIEVLAALGWTINNHWYLMGSVGGGSAFTVESVTWSVRSFFLLTGSGDVAFRMSLFAQWTPGDGSVFLQLRIGPSLRLGQTNHRIFPNIGLTTNIPTNGEAMTARFVPGCAIIFNL